MHSLHDGFQIFLLTSIPALAIYNTPDVRLMLKQYQGKDVVAEYAKVEADGKRRHIEAWKRGVKSEIAPPSWLSWLFNVGSHSVRNLPFSCHYVGTKTHY